MRNKAFILLFFTLSIFSACRSQSGLIEVECLRGVEIAGNYCYFCPPNGSTVFDGLKIDYGNGRLLYIRKPYVARFRDADSLTVITFDREQRASFRLSQTVYPTMDTLRSIIEACAADPVTPVDTVDCCPTVDTFMVVDGILYFSLSSEDVVYSANICCDTAGGVVSVYRQYFADVTGDTLTVSVHGDTLPGISRHIAVYVEGIRQKEGPPGAGDYQYSDSTIVFNYSLAGEDAWIWFIDRAEGITTYQEFFTDVSADTVLISGSFPADTAQVNVFVEGIRQIQGAPGSGDYRINGNRIDFNYTLSSEDVEVWFIDQTGPLSIFSETFLDATGTTVTVTANGGTIPALNQATLVFVEGLNQQEGSAGDYETSGSNFNFKYTLSSEDVSTHFLIGTTDMGVLGLFQN